MTPTHCTLASGPKRTAMDYTQEEIDMGALLTPSMAVMAAMLLLELVAGSIVLNAADSDGVVWTQATLRACCLMGAILGGVLCVSAMPEPDRKRAIPPLNPMQQAKALAAKGVSSAIAGTLFTPVAIRWMGWPLDADIVIAVSGGIAFLFVGTVNVIAPRWQAFLLRRADKYLGETDPRMKRHRADDSTLDTKTEI